jgi:hypothetical protein
MSVRNIDSGYHGALLASSSRLSLIKFKINTVTQATSLHEESASEELEPHRIMSILWAVPKIDDLTILLDSILDCAQEEARLSLG